MKYLIIFLFTTFFSVAQKTNLAYYNINYLYENEDNSIDSRYSFYLDSAKQYENDVLLTLAFNNERSVFQMLTTHKNSMNEMAFNFCHCDKDVFMNTKTNSIRFLNKGSLPMNLPEDKYLLEQPLLSNWEIHEESKEIQGFKVLKATRNKQTVDGLTIPITAWFAPELPFSFGPSYYGGLPGLIIQVQDVENMFTLSKIEFDKNLELLNEPIGKEIMSAEEYNKMEYQNYLDMVN